jgi:hypothetical protein
MTIIATCRGCEKKIEQRAGHWMDPETGIMACVKAPAGLSVPPVLHLPMPAGLVGAPVEEAAPGEQAS